MISNRLRNCACDRRATEHYSTSTWLACARRTDRTTQRSVTDSFSKQRGKQSPPDALFYVFVFALYHFCVFGGFCFAYPDRVCEIANRTLCMSFNSILYTHYLASQPQNFPAVMDKAKNPNSSSTANDDGSKVRQNY